MKKVLVFASGSAQGGGSGFENLVKAKQNDILHAEIVGVVSNYEYGGVREKAERLGVQFTYFPKPWTAKNYQKIALDSGADFFALSGWLKLVKGLDLKTKFNSKTVFNIHPGPLPAFGGKGMHGHHVHKAVLTDFLRGEIVNSAVSMHFVTEEFDKGPSFLNFPVKMKKEGETAETLGLRVNMFEHIYQPIFTDMVINGLITWDGINPNSLFISSECLELSHKIKVAVAGYDSRYVTLDTSDEICEKFGFHHGDIAISTSNDPDKSTLSNGNEVVILGVGKGNEGEDVMWYTTYNAKHFLKACYWGGKRNLLEAGFIKIS